MTTLKGIFPDTKPVKGKNFIQENVKNLRRIEHSHVNKEIEETQKSQAYNRKKIISDNSNNNRNRTHNVLTKMNSNFRIKKHSSNDVNSNVNSKVDQHQELCKKSSAPMLNKNNVTKKVNSASNNLLIKERKKEHKGLHNAQKLQEKVSSDPNFLYKSAEDIENNPKVKIKVKNQGIQTLDAKEIDDLYSEGTIRYPSKKYINDGESINKNKTNDKLDLSSRNTTNSPSDRGDIQLSEKSPQNKNDTKNTKLQSSREEINFIKLNKDHTSTANKTATQMNNCNNNNILPTNYRVGEVPKYIKNRKEIQEKEQNAKIEELDPTCPKGHVPLPDNERKETLRMLRKNYQDYVNELNMMPIKVDTLRAQRRKMEIEKQLNKLEEGIKVFSRPKVYVKMNA